jgi:hypothetical protein
MATLLLTAVGTAIGGPLGGALGAFLGRQADQKIFGSGSREGPRLRELSVTTSSYGQPMPRHFGRMRVAGTVIWSTELMESTTKDGGGKGKPSTTTYSYSASFAVALSSTPISRVGRIWADGNLLRGMSGDLKVEGQMRTYLGYGDDPVDPVIAADRGAQTPAFRDCAYVVFEDLQLGDFGNRIPALTFEVIAPGDSTVSLQQIVPQSTNGSADVVLANTRGFADEGGALVSSLAAIDRVFPLSCVTTSKGLRITSATSMPANVPTLPEQLSTNDGEEAQARHKQRADQLGNEPMALRYYDEGRDYQPGVQRAIGSRASGREIMVDLPAAMTADGARQLANSNAHRARWQHERVTWTVGELDPRIGPGAVVRLPDTPGFWLVKSWEWYDRGIELRLDRLAPELGVTLASDAGLANAPADLEASATILVALEIPPDGTSNPSTPLLFAAASSSGAGWRGAALYLARGSTLEELGPAGNRRATMGELAGALASSFATFFEANAFIDVDLPAGDLSFDSTDLTGLALGANRLMVGAELIQFCSAAPLGANRWRLSGLLRGRAGTEDAAAGGHAIGATVVRLDDRLTALDPSQVPAETNTQIGAIGRGDPETVFAALENAGLSRRPLMPVHPRLSVLDDGAWEVCWTRRARGAWRWEDAIEVPLIEESEAYIAGFGPCDAPFASWSLSEARLVLSVTERELLFSNHGPGTLWVRQSGTFSQSSPLHIASIS